MRRLQSYASSGFQCRGGRGINDQLCDVFLKVGGSILDRDDLTAELVHHLATLSDEQRILILPGGGQVVKRIKANQRRHGSDFYGCWVPAVLNLDVNAGIIASYSKSVAVASSAEEIAGCFETGKVVVFAAAGAVFNSLHLTPDFQATTDSMGLYFARAFGARRYVIVSDVDGIYSGSPNSGDWGEIIERLTLEELEHLPSSKLDPSFPEYFRRYAVPTVIVNGKHPNRVSAAIRGDRTISTEIGVRVS